MLPAVAQGASASRSAPMTSKTRDLVAAINHETSAIAVDCERAFLAALDGSCRTPLAGHATLKDGRISLPRRSADPDGAHCFDTTRDGGVSDAARMGHEAGEEVKARGGALIAY